MPTTRIEKIVVGSVVAVVERSRKTGNYHCHHRGSNVDAVEFGSLDQVAEFLRANPGSGVRMEPGWSKIVDHIYIDGMPR
jgi:urease beta subunit